jgi:hypothetical protein
MSAFGKPRVVPRQSLDEGYHGPDGRVVHPNMRFVPRRRWTTIEALGRSSRPPIVGPQLVRKSVAGGHR